MKATTTDRYPGLRPFEESERSMFFGRSIELEELGQAININDLFVIHGESGLGKSSLINAGLIPLLREKGFYPILIRFKERSKAPLQQVLQELRKLLRDVDQKSVAEDNKLWIWVKLLNSRALKPILIFDQFEEFSYFNADDRLKLVKALAELLSPKIPAYARDITPSVEEDQTFSWYTQPQVKLLFSLRSDRISILEDFSELMPAMLRSRYQLKPILLEQVEQIVVMPAVMESFDSMQFDSAPFQYQPALINDVIDVVKDKKRNTVETTQLQMICQEIESLVKTRQQRGEKNICVTQKDLSREKLEDLVDDFYTKQLDKISASTEPPVTPDEFIAIRLLLEKRLLVHKKRIPLAEATVFQHFTDFFREKNAQLDDEKVKLILDLLLKTRLIRDQTYGDSLFYELSHDTLIEPISEAMAKRESDERRKRVQDERRAQELEILKQKKYIDEIEAQRKRAEDALKDLEVAVKEQKKQTQIAEDTLKQLKDARQKEAVTRRRFTWVVTAIVVIVFAAVISYVVLLRIKNEKSNNLLARVYRSEAKNNYDMGNQQVAYRYLVDALDKSSDAELNKELKQELQKNFAAFAGMTMPFVSSDQKYVAARLKDSTWYFWEVGEKKATLLKKTLHRERLSFFNKNWYYVNDTGRRIRIYSFSDTAVRRFRNGYMDLDTTKVFSLVSSGNFFFIRSDLYDATAFSLDAKRRTDVINRFFRANKDSVREALSNDHLFPVKDSAFVICTVGERSFYLDLYKDNVYELPCFVGYEQCKRLGNQLAVWKGKSVVLLDLTTREARTIGVPHREDVYDVGGLSADGRYLAVSYLSLTGFDKILYAYDLTSGKRFKITDQYDMGSIVPHSLDIPFVNSQSRLFVFNARNRKVYPVVDSLDNFLSFDNDSTTDKVFYERGSQWYMANRSTLARDTTFGEGTLVCHEQPLIQFTQYSSDTTIIYDCMKRRVIATIPPSKDRFFADLYGTRFVSFNPRQTSRYGPAGLYYVQFLDSNLRVNENLQKYFKPYLDDVMNGNK